MRSDKYTLVDKKPVPVSDLTKWAKGYETLDRRVAYTDVGDVKVSTVFLGLDHNFSDDGPPVLFETCVFGGTLDGEMDRYSTWDEAEAGHAAMVARVAA